MADPEGRFLFIRGKLFNMVCTIANIYSLNKDPDKFLKGTLKKLDAFKEGKLIIACDLNWSIDPILDTSGSSSWFTAQRQRALKKVLLDFQLTDAWRIRHPGKQHYTFYSPVHQTFSRIDYVLINTNCSHVLKEQILKQSPSLITPQL